jgi:hypothetical protein
MVGEAVAVDNLRQMFAAIGRKPPAYETANETLVAAERHVRAYPTATDRYLAERA